MQPNNFFSLEQIIDRQPLTVPPETPLTEVIRQMQEWANSCHLRENHDASDAGSTIKINNSCALVVEDARLQGIFTERDLVKLIATERDLAEIAVGEVMSRELITLTVTGVEDVFTALNLLRQHSVRHLPIIDQSDRLLGLITEKNLRQNLKPLDLMKWRRVKEVMSERVIHAPPTISVRQGAKLMAENQVSYVAIVKSEPEANELLIPVGIITERDIVQFQALNLDFSQPVQGLMSNPLFLVNPEDSLWAIHQLMQQRRVRRLLVAGSQGELRGIISQTKLLQVFDPIEMYGIIDILQQQVCELENERAKYLEARARKIEKQVNERTSELKQAHQQLFFHVNNTPLAVVEWDSNFCVKHWSERAEQIFGWSKSEVMGKHWRDWQFVLEEDVEGVIGIASRLFDSTEPRNISHNGNYTKKGTIVICEWYNSVLLDEAGNLRSVLSLVQDISEREKALSDRKRREEILKDIASGISVATGVNFLPSFCEYLCKTLKVDYAFVGELIQPEADKMETLAIYGRGQVIDNFTYPMAGTPCQEAIEQGLRIYPEVIPHDLMLQEMAAESYAGIINIQ